MSTCNLVLTHPGYNSLCFCPCTMSAIKAHFYFRNECNENMVMLFPLKKFNDISVNGTRRNKSVCDRFRKIIPNYNFNFIRRLILRKMTNCFAECVRDKESHESNLGIVFFLQIA